MFDSNLDKIVLSFRGTNGVFDIQNVLANINMSKMSIIDGTMMKVHNGYLDAYLKINSSTILTLRSLQDRYPRAGILITGYSMGGALAQLAAYFLHKELMGFSLKDV